MSQEIPGAASPWTARGAARSPPSASAASRDGEGVRGSRSGGVNPSPRGTGEDARERTVDGPGRRRVVVLSEQLIRTCCERLAVDKGVRRTLPGRGRLHVDRKLPFLCVYRRRSDDAGTASLVKSEAAYLISPDGLEHREGVSALVRSLVETLAAEFGSYLIIEIWCEVEGSGGREAHDPSSPPSIRILAPPARRLAGTIDVLARGLGEVRVMKQRVDVEVVRSENPWPPDLPPLLDPPEAEGLHCHTLGIRVPPVYRDGTSGREFPAVLRSVRRAISQALKPAVYRFSRSLTTHRPPHYHELGRRAVVKAVWEVDRKLSEVSGEFDFLVLSTPVNSGEAWAEFRASGFDRVPEFHYRPAPCDPALLKRKLFQIPIERVEDPALQHLFQEKQEELDVKISMLRDRDSPRYLPGSLRLYGGVEDDLLDVATKVLETVPQRDRKRRAGTSLGARELAERARVEFERYAATGHEFPAKARVTAKAAGVMVSRGSLLIHPGVRISRRRAAALIEHEVGTHLVTYFNGAAQPFRQLQSGLAAYEELQEGLAVLAEHLAGGLDPSRLRQLAARVVAARRVVEGAELVEIWREIHRTHGIGARSAFTTAMRICRSGGLTKDAVYLRGLRRLLDHVASGGDVEGLFVGKFALEHVPIIEELRIRRVLVDPPFRSRCLDAAGAADRLRALRESRADLLSLIRRSPSGDR